MRTVKYHLDFKKSLADFVLPMIFWTFLIFVSFGVLFPFFLLFLGKTIVNNTTVEVRKFDHT